MLDGVIMQNILRLVALESDDQPWRSAIVEGLGEMARSGAGYDTVTEASATGIGGMLTAANAAALGRTVYYRGYATSDGYIAIGCLNLNQQRRLNEALELGEPRFEAGMDLESPQAIERAAAMEPRAEQLFALKSTDEWLEFLDGRSIACGRRAQSPRSLREPSPPREPDDRRARRSLGRTCSPARSSLKFDKTPMTIRQPASPSGHDTDEMLAWLNYSPEKIQALRGDSVVF